MSNQVCTYCGFSFPNTKLKCPSCRQWNTRNNPRINSNDDGTVTLDKVKAATTKRIITGIYDYCFGGGVVETSVTVLGGYPGAGKTTFVLQFMDKICEITQGESLMLSAEMLPEEVKDYSMRLKLNNPHMIRMLDARGGTFEIGDILINREPKLIVLDSIQMFVGEDMEAQVKTCKIIKDYCAKLKCPAIIISHVTKGGDFAGFMKLQHVVDILQMFNKVQDPIIDAEFDGDIREWEVIKSRCGPVCKQYFEMTEFGVIPGLTDKELEKVLMKREEREERDEDE